MEELRAAALAYYSQGTQQTKALAWSFFRSMDTNHDGRISCSEFNDFLQQSGYNWIINDPNFFSKLDQNRNGSLDFEEVLTFLYIIKTRYIWCKGCNVYLCGLYFTCVSCFDGAAADRSTYDLCAVCYGNQNFQHQYYYPHHTFFLDNHVLLRSKRLLPPNASPDLSMVIYTPQPPQSTPAVIFNNYNIPALPERNQWFHAFHLFDTALSAANLVANCAIM